MGQRGWGVGGWGGCEGGGFDSLYGDDLLGHDRKDFHIDPVELVKAEIRLKKNLPIRKAGKATNQFSKAWRTSIIL